ncbi:hypothetical protein V1514DRAFT_71361 [Lipomyces japonicus]|uniref:uncharacterized protein n=1 Tax=Lipomyces japonicus TaxID=56871 RepID=UPI0034CD48E5
MGKKKSAAATLERLIARPWCYYCDRDFDDLKVLISHQRAQHLKCDQCNKRLNTAGGLVIHAQQVHKEIVTTVHNAIQGRENVDLEIFGMEGVPQVALQDHEEQIRHKFSIPDADLNNHSYDSRHGDISSKYAKIRSVDKDALLARLDVFLNAKKSGSTDPAAAVKAYDNENLGKESGLTASAVSL